MVKRDPCLAGDVGELRNGKLCSDEREAERKTRHHEGSEETE
jgi:hypothetical protein